MLQSEAVCTSRRQWLQVHRLPHDNISFSPGSLSSCLLISLLLPLFFLPISSLWISMDFSFLLLFPHVFPHPLLSFPFLVSSPLFISPLPVHPPSLSPLLFSFLLFSLLSSLYLYPPLLCSFLILSSPPLSFPLTSSLHFSPLSSISPSFPLLFCPVLTSSPPCLLSWLLPLSTVVLLSSSFLSPPLHLSALLTVFI